MNKLIQYFRRGSDVLAMQAAFAEDMEREAGQQVTEPPAPRGFRNRTAQSVLRGLDVLNNELDEREMERERLKAALAVVDQDIGELHESLAILSTAAEHFRLLGAQAQG